MLRATIDILTFIMTINVVTKMLVLMNVLCTSQMAIYVVMWYYTWNSNNTKCKK